MANDDQAETVMEGRADRVDEAADAFQTFALPHLVVLALTLGIVVLMVWVARWSRRTGGRFAARALRWQEAVLLVALLLTYPAKLAVMLTSEGSSWDYRLPLHLCDLGAYIAAGALFLRSQRLAELAYFWGLLGTMQGLLTPALSYGYPHIEFFRFFLLHTSVVVAACYLPWGRGLRPDHGAPWRAFAWLQVYMVIAFAANVAFGSNYGFLMNKPPTASLLDHLGEWPYYLVALEGVALAGFWVLYLPWVRPAAGSPPTKSAR